MRHISIRQLTLNSIWIAALLSLSAASAMASTISTSVVLTITSPSTIYFGQTVNGYAQVNSSDGSPLTGIITFYDGTAAICAISTAADATCPESAGANFAAGTHLVTAVYSGDAEHSGSTSNAAAVTVLQDTTTTSLTSTTASAPYGQDITFTANVQGAHGTPSGSVRFYDGSNVIGTALMSADVATLSVSTLPVGTHAITAAYQATTNSASSTSPTLSEVIQPISATTTTTLFSSADPAISGQNLTLTASVTKTPPSSQPPTGTVTFLDGNAVLGTATLDNNGSASFSTFALDTGTHILTASYGGDATTKGSISPGLTELVSTSASQSGTSPTFSISTTPIIVKVGQTASVPIKISSINGFSQAVQLGCRDLPVESACTFGTSMIRANGGSTTLQFSTMAPHDCGSATSYYGGLPWSAPVAAVLTMLLIPGRKRYITTFKGLLMALVVFCSLTAVTGCGNCTDLGTRPGTYTIYVTGAAQSSTPITVSQKLILKVVP